MRDHQAVYPIATMCRVLRVSPNGYYAWRHRGPSARAQRDAVLLASIAHFHDRSDQTYGAPRIWKDLREEAGHAVGQKRVARRMRRATSSASVVVAAYGPRGAQRVGLGPGQQVAGPWEPTPLTLRVCRWPPSELRTTHSSPSYTARPASKSYGFPMCGSASSLLAFRRAPVVQSGSGRRGRRLRGKREPQGETGSRWAHASRWA